MRSMREDEANAKYLLEYLLPGSNLVYKGSQSKGEHDFDLVHSDGGGGIVEVTSIPDTALQETWYQVLNKKRGGPRIAAQLCNRPWYVVFPPGTRVDRIRRSIDKHLAAIESAGIESFNGLTDIDPSVRKIHDELGVTWGCALPDWIKCRGVFMGLPGPFGRPCPDSAIGAAEIEAWKPDNRRKLGAHTRGERHLVVYAPVTALAAYALWDFEPPRVVANLPPEISDIWIIGDRRVARDTDDDYVTWRSSATAPWQKLTVSFDGR